MRRRTRLLVAGAVVAGLGLGGLLAGVVVELGPAGAAPAAPSLDPGTVLSGFGRDSGTATTVARLEGELVRSGPDADRLDDLGLAYQVRWRETGDAAFLPLSERSLRRVLELRPKDATATLALGNLALIRHDFRSALVLGREAHRRAPYAVRPYGVVGDALVELGRYRSAFATFDRMAALKPSSSTIHRHFSGPPAIPIVRHPLIRATCPAMLPVAPAAPETTTVSTSRGRPTSSSPKYAVRPVMPSAPR